MRPPAAYAAFVLIGSLFRFGGFFGCGFAGVKSSIATIFRNLRYSSLASRAAFAYDFPVTFPLRVIASDTARESVSAAVRIALQVRHGLQ